MTSGAARFVAVGRVEDVPADRARIFHVEDRDIAVFHLPDGYYAIDDLCTHDGGPLGEGLLEDDEAVCPRHGARFNVRTGAATRFPAITPVATYPVRIERDEILIGLPD